MGHTCNLPYFLVYYSISTKNVIGRRTKNEKREAFAFLTPIMPCLLCVRRANLIKERVFVWWVFISLHLSLFLSVSSLFFLLPIQTF